MPRDARDQEQLAVLRHRPDFIDGFSKRDELEIRRLEHDHHSALFLLQGAHGASAVSQTQLSIDRGRRSGSRQLPERERVHLLIGPALEFEGDLFAGLTRSVNHMEPFSARSSGGEHGFQL